MTLLSQTWEEQLDQLEQLTYTIPADDPKAYLVVPDAEVEFDGGRFYIAETVDVHADGQLTKQVTANALWYRLAEKKVIGALDLSSLTPRQGVTAILAATDTNGWTLDPASSTSASTFTANGQDQTVLWHLRNWAKVCGMYLLFDTAEQRVQIAETRGAELPFSLRFGRNVTSIRRTIRPPRVTRLWPYGRQGLSISDVNSGVPYVEDFSYYTALGLTLSEARAAYTKDEVYSDETMIDATSLLAAANTLLGKLAQPTVIYEMTAATLAEVSGVPEATVRAGQTVRVYDAVLDLNVQVTVTRVLRSRIEPWLSLVELATLDDLTSFAGATTSRSDTSLNWDLFVSDALLPWEVRNDGTWTICRIELDFGGADGAAEGEAVFGVGYQLVGVGVGSVSVSAVDATNDALVYEVHEYDFTDGQIIYGTMSWADQGIYGSHDYRIRVSAGTGAGVGVNIEQDSVHFWILARGAFRYEETLDNCTTFSYSATEQTFVVPDNVEEVTITARGGGGQMPTIGGSGGAAGTVSGRIPVTPGQTLYVYVGQKGSHPLGSSTTYGIGGTGGAFSSAGGQGGDASWVSTSSQGWANRIIVAPGGGGGGAGTGANARAGGAGRFWTGDDGLDGPGAFPDQGYKGGGGTQSAGGAGGSSALAHPGEAGDTDAGGAGGDAYAGGGGGVGSGGGGGGHHGGGGGGGEGASGGGGSGYILPSSTSVTVTDADPASLSGGDGEHGEITICYATPILG